MFVDPEEVKHELRWSRAELIRAIDRHEHFDVAVVGGGIHGAAIARLAAFNGLKTALFESADYAAATSSRSSKLAHGGLRYLAMGDFQQVFESVKAREDLFLSAHHLVRPYPFLIPIAKPGLFDRVTLACGLSLYELFSRSRARRHRWIAAQDKSVRAIFGERASAFRGCYRYYDGIMSDSRLALETVLAARQEGARCINYARVDSAVQRISNQVEVGWTDLLSGEKHQLSAGVVVNCTGPWAPFFGRLAPQAGRVCYSRGSHLIFDRPWDHPALFMPLQGKNRYYFVLPHPAGTLVGTTEREVHGEPALDPLPSSDEIEEILARLKKDLPNQRLDRSSLSYGFAGIRTLPMKRGARDTSAISRKHVWDLQGGVLTLYGGKYTSAYWTAYEGLKMVQSTSTKGFQLTPLTGRELPGAFGAEAALKELLSRCQDDRQRMAAVSAFRIFGGRVRYFEGTDFELVGERVLRGALRIALEYEQVETVEDLMRRRLELEYFPGNGLELLTVIAPYIAEYRPGRDLGAQISDYRARIAGLRAVLGLKPA